MDIYSIHFSPSTYVDGNVENSLFSKELDYLKGIASALIIRDVIVCFDYYREWTIVVYATYSCYTILTQPFKLLK